MHLFRGHRQRRALLDQIGIKRVAAGQRGQPHRVARDREIRLDEEIPHPLMRGRDHVADLLRIRRLQPRLVGSRDRRRECLHRTVEGRALDPFCDQIFEFVDHVGDDQLGLDDFVLHALAEQDDRAVQHRGILCVAL
jgi:hypothetical protein